MTVTEYGADFGTISPIIEGEEKDRKPFVPEFGSCCDNCVSAKSFLGKTKLRYCLLALQPNQRKCEGHQPVGHTFKKKK